MLDRTPSYDRKLPELPEDVYRNGSTKVFNIFLRKLVKKKQIEGNFVRTRAPSSSGFKFIFDEYFLIYCCSTL